MEDGEEGGWRDHDALVGLQDVERRGSSTAMGMLDTEGMCVGWLWRMGSCAINLGGQR